MTVALDYRIEWLKQMCGIATRWDNNSELLSLINNQANASVIMDMVDKYGTSPYLSHTASDNDPVTGYSNKLVLILRAIKIRLKYPLPNSSIISTTCFNLKTYRTALAKEKQLVEEKNVSHEDYGNGYYINRLVVDDYIAELEALYAKNNCDKEIVDTQQMEQISVLNAVTQDSLTQPAGDATKSKTTTYFVYAVAAIIIVAVMVKLFKQ